MSNFDCPPCCACDSDRHTLVLKKNGFDIVKCQTCGLMHAEPLLTPEQIDELYTGDTGPGKPGIRKSRLLMARRILRMTGGGDLLEVGCQSGDFLAAAQHVAGIHAFGMDTNPDAVSRAVARGLEVKQGSLEQPTYDPESFDVIYMEQVIEHLRDPLAGLMQARNLLKPGGHLFAITPGHEHPRARMAGANWHYYMLPIHLHYYSKRSIDLICRKVGLRLVRASVFHYHTHLTVHAVRA